MTKIYIIPTDNNNFISKVYKEGTQPDNALDLLYTGNFIKPKLNLQNLEFYEGATPEEVQSVEDAKVIECMAKKTELILKLTISALQRVTGKGGTFDSLLIQKDEYEEKYKVAKEHLENLPISNNFMLQTLNTEKDFIDHEGVKLHNEITSYGLTSLNDRLLDFCQIVKFRFEYVFPLHQEFNSQIPIIRVTLEDDINFGNFSRFEKRVLIVEDVLNNNYDKVDLTNKFIEFNETA